MLLKTVDDISLIKVSIALLLFHFFTKLRQDII
jgi:hypothetical protein